MTTRPSFIRSAFELPEVENRYPEREEVFSYSRAFGKLAGLERIGLHWERLPPGHRTSLPHAEEKEEEFVVVLEGSVEAWIDGVRYPMVRGDIAAFPAGTGIVHTFINEGESEAILLVGGERSKPDNRIVYPLDPWRRGQLKSSEWWDDAPVHAQGSASAEAARKG
jgi:uncharacterized cupin superfamily protein